MSFTQENKTNLHNVPDETICDGCDNHCKFGFRYLDHRECHPFVHWIYPTIDGKVIKQYRGKNGKTFYTRRTVPYKLGAEYVYPARQAIELAHEIAKLCDHYKTR